MRVNPNVTESPSPWLATATPASRPPTKTAPCRKRGFGQRGARSSGPRRPAARAGTGGTSWSGSWTSSTPGTNTVQTCIVHLLRRSLEFVAYKDRKAVAAALKDIYRAVDGQPERPLCRLRGRPLGPQIHGHCPELATGLGRGGAVL